MTVKQVTRKKHAGIVVLLSHLSIITCLQVILLNKCQELLFKGSVEAAQQTSMVVQINYHCMLIVNTVHQLHIAKDMYCQVISLSVYVLETIKADKTSSSQESNLGLNLKQTTKLTYWQPLSFLSSAFNLKMD